VFGVIIEALGIALAAPGVLWRLMFGPKKPPPGKKPPKTKPKKRR
jgi:hypothetical protein